MAGSSRSSKSSGGADTMTKIKLGGAIAVLVIGVLLILWNFNIIGPDPATAKLPTPPSPTEGLSAPEKKVFEQLKAEQVEQERKHPPAGS